MRDGAGEIPNPPAIRGASNVFLAILARPCSLPWNDFVQRAVLVISGQVNFVNQMGEISGENLSETVSYLSFSGSLQLISSSDS